MKQSKKARRKSHSSASSSSSSDSDESTSSSDSNDSKTKTSETYKRKSTDTSSKPKHDHHRQGQRSDESEEEPSKKTKWDEGSSHKKYRDSNTRSGQRPKEDYDDRDKHNKDRRRGEPERSRHSELDRRKDRNDDRTSSTKHKYRDREESNRYDKNRDYRTASSRERGREGDERRVNSREGYRHKNEAFDNRRDNRYNRNKRGRSSSFDHTNAKWGKTDEDSAKKSKGKPAEKEKPNFGLSGKLAEQTNTYRGFVIKYSEPPEARKPKRRWRLYPFKGEKALQTLFIHRESAYLIGRERKIVDLPVDHPSCSKQHAVLQYRLVPFTREDGSTGKKVRPYLIDLESANGTFINNKKIDPKKYVELLERDVIKFGFSSREYVLLHENSKDEIQDDDVKQEEEVNVKDEPGN